MSVFQSGCSIDIIFLTLSFAFLWNYPMNTIYGANSGEGKEQGSRRMGCIMCYGPVLPRLMCIQITYDALKMQILIQ